MPLPKAPTRPATLLDLNDAVIARARRKTAADGAEQGPATPASAPATSSSPARRSAPASQTLNRSAAQIVPARPATATGASRAALLQAVPSPGVTSGIEARQPDPAEAGAPGSTTRSAAGTRRQRPRQKQAAQEVATTALLPEQVKLFVLDTNVLMHDPSSLFRFEEHDVFLPIVTLEELDNNKKGMSEVARNARQVSRSLDALVGDVADGIEAGIALAKLGHREARGRLLLQTEALETSLPATLATGKADNQILGVVQALQRLHPRDRKSVV